MIARLAFFFMRLRRAFNSSEWLIKLFKLDVSTEPANAPGLVLIQIDGLSKREFERALNRNELPFLAKLIRHQHYHLHQMYSGLPASTPAFQAELFYGIKTAVPAFGFKDHQSDEVVRMYEPSICKKTEKILNKTGNDALLKGGSVYADVYTGGAEEAHFCPAALGWGNSLRLKNPLTLLILLFTNLYTLLNIPFLLTIEFVLAIIDYFRGIIAGHDFIKELKFIPTRIAISILLRELTVMGVKMDISRGLPIIHLNFLGYDEQAHRRGPRSWFAHWTLKGIDHAIQRIWTAVHRLTRRDYDVWIYSDHGQDTVTSFQKATGKTLEQVVSSVMQKFSPHSADVHTHDVTSIQTHRVRFLGGNKIQKLFSVLTDNSFNVADNEQHQVVAMGSVGFIYPACKLSLKQQGLIAHELTCKENIPLCIINGKNGGLSAWTAQGEFHLPDQITEIIGKDHPFVNDISQDIQALCQHPDAGTIVLFGWCKGKPPISFAEENGAHAGLSPEETNAFALLPIDVPLAKTRHHYLQATDLRRAVINRLTKVNNVYRKLRKSATDKKKHELRVMTYNVHSCIGMDGNISPERIARVINQYAPDVILLQELDVGRNRTEGVDQAQHIADILAMDCHFHPAMHYAEEKYGNAILTHLPMRIVKTGILPRLKGKTNSEFRGALWVAVEVDDKEVQFINTHLGLQRRERMQQVDMLLGTEWLANGLCKNPVILGGDFNALPSSKVCKKLNNYLHDAQSTMKDHKPIGTFYRKYPKVCIDHIYLSSNIDVLDIQVPRTKMVQVASDHLPLVVDLCI